MTQTKRLTRTNAIHVATGQPISGFEIHIGHSEGPDCARPFAMIGSLPEGAISTNGRVMGSYLHGMFANDEFRAGFLRQIGAQASGLHYSAGVDAVLDALAAHLESHVDVTALLGLAR